MNIVRKLHKKCMIEKMYVHLKFVHIIKHKNKYMKSKRIKQFLNSV